MYYTIISIIKIFLNRQIIYHISGNEGGVIMEQLFQKIQQYVDKHKKSDFPFFSMNRPYDAKESVYKGIHYYTFLEDRCFQSDQVIRVKVEQLTQFEQKYNVPHRQKTMHNHEFFEIVYVYSGKCICDIDETSIELHQGDIVLHSPKAIHCAQTPDDGDVIINILVRKRLFDQTFLNMTENNNLVTGFFMDALYNPNSNQRYVVFKNGQMVAAPIIILLMLQEYQENAVFCQSTLPSYFICLLSDMARCYTNTLAHIRLPRNSIDISSLLSYININCQTVSIQQLAKQFHYSVRSISGFIQRETGKTFRQLLQSYRLQQSCQYLTKTDVPLDQISELVGYSQRSTFERAFKEYFHCTPAQYRKTHQ